MFSVGQSRKPCLMQQDRQARHPNSTLHVVKIVGPNFCAFGIVVE
jgi:hypothetical protein